MKWALVTLLLLGTGCHAKFKKHASSLGAVRPQVIHLSGPTVSLGTLDVDEEVPGEAVLERVAGVAQNVRAQRLADRLARAIDVDTVDASLVVALDESLGQGPPFALTDDPAAPLLQIELLNYGLNVPHMGEQGWFEFNVRARIYLADGKRVYTTYQTCSVPAGQPSATSRVLGTVDNVRQIQRMTDAQITQAFATAAEACGVELTRRIRRHAG